MKTVLLAAGILSAGAMATSASAGNYGMPSDWGAPTTCTGTDWLKCMTGNKTYKLVFSDEFNTMQLANPGSVNSWFVGVHPVMQAGEKMAWAGDGYGSYTDPAGVLTLSTRYSVVTAGVFCEADVESLDDSGHGHAWQNFYAEVRMRGPQNNTNHNGVWFLSKDNGRTDSTGGHTEVDLVEQYGPNDQFDHSSSHFWPGRRTDIQHTYTSTLTARPEGKAIDWHTYGLLATDTQFVIARDGKPIKVIQRTPQQRAPLYLLLSIFGNPGMGTRQAASMQVDYVRVYTPPDEQSAPAKMAK